MMLSVISLLFLISSNVLLCHAQTDHIMPGERYSCRVFGEPQFSSWTAITVPERTPVMCTGTRNFTLIKNSYIDYKIRAVNGYTKHIDVKLFDGVTSTPICIVSSKDFAIVPSSNCGDLAPKAGTFSGTTTQYIYHNMIDFTATIIHNANNNGYLHFNQQIFLEGSIAKVSTGMCTNSICSQTRALLPELRSSSQIISLNLARTICEVYLNSYLEEIPRAAYQRSARYNSTIQMLRDACSSDVMITGNPHAAVSEVEVLMAEEFQTGIRNSNTRQMGFIANDAAISSLTKANERSKAAVSKMFGF